MNDQLNLLQHLTRADIDFVIVGGFAGVVHGCNYVTQDIDICYVFSPTNLMALQEALAELHPVHRMTPGRKPLALTAENATQFNKLYLDTDLSRLDCLSEIAGLGDYTQVKQASELIDIEGMHLHVLTLNALIKTKKSMNRPRDRDILLQLQAIKALKRDSN